MLIDLHVHTRNYSGCSDIEIKDLIERAPAVGLAGVVLTEHAGLWPADKLAPWRERAARSGLLVLAGQEVTCLSRGRRWDFLVFGLERGLASGPSPQDLIRRVHGEGGVIVAAHPYKPSRLGGGYSGPGDEIMNLEVDAIELFHPDQDQAARNRIMAVARNTGRPLTGGSDAHELFQLGRYATKFLTPVTDLVGLISAIKKRTIEPVNGTGR
ncbi:MAG: PHP-associated domain-containing protein [Thermodesulfobacteriota bacterium]